MVSTSNSSLQGPAQSPAKKYSSLRAKCLEATAILFCGLNEVKASRLDIAAPTQAASATLPLLLQPHPGS